MGGDVEVDIDPTNAENDALAVENGSLGGSMGAMSGLSLNLSPFNSNCSNSNSNSQPRSRDASFETEVRRLPFSARSLASPGLPTQLN